MFVLGFWVAPLLVVVGTCIAVADVLRQSRRRRVSITALIVNLATLAAFVLMLFWFASLMEGVGVG